jgi:hypothetical protein
MVRCIPVVTMCCDVFGFDNRCWRFSVNMPGDTGGVTTVLPAYVTSCYGTGGNYWPYQRCILTWSWSRSI